MQEGITPEQGLPPARIVDGELLGTVNVASLQIAVDVREDSVRGGLLPLDLVLDDARLYLQ